MRLLGIYREKECSPGRHQSNDAQLLERVAVHLQERGFTIDLTTLDQARMRPANTALVLSMCQSRAGLDLLASWEKDGVHIVNSPRASRNTHRDRLPELMVRAGIPFPATETISTTGPVSLRAQVEDGLWLKRGDVHASVSADVQRVDSRSAFEAGRADFASRGITTAAVQAHRAGDEIKFYGVAGGGFFHWFYSGESHGYAFDPLALPRLAARAAAAAGLDIYGGDVIVSSSGELTLIDLNDWPSFAPCRERAAETIADSLTRRVHGAWNPGLVSNANESAL